MPNSIRLNFIVEGTTEEIFVRDVLKEPFAEKYIFVSARRVETSRKQLRNVDYNVGAWGREDPSPLGDGMNRAPLLCRKLLIQSTA